MNAGARVEHIVHKIHGTILRVHSMGPPPGQPLGRYVEVLWDDDGSPTESGQRYLDANRNGEPGPVYSVTTLSMLCPVSAVEQLGELMS